MRGESACVDKEALNKLAKIGIRNLYEAILYVPKSYTNTFLMRDLGDSSGAIFVQIIDKKRLSKILKIRAYAPHFDCDIDINIFHPKPFHNALFAVGKEMYLFGVVEQFNGTYQINQPKIITQINQIVANFPTTKMKNANLNEIFREVITRQSLASLGLESAYIKAIYTIFHPSNSGNSSLGNHFADLANRHKARTQSPLSLCRFAKNYESTTANTRIILKENAESAPTSSLRGSEATEAIQDSANAESILNCHIERSEISQNRDSSLVSLAQNDKIIAESKNLPSLAEDSHKNIPLPCGGGLRGWVDSQNNHNAKFSNNDFTHPLAPSAREGETDFTLDSTNYLRDFKRNGGLFGIYLEAIKFVEILYYTRSLAGKKREFLATNRLNNAPLLESFIKNLPFSLTQGQSNAIAFLRAKLDSEKATRCVVMGDVGCGKTMVILSCVVLTYPKKSVLLAPTTILAQQLYAESKKFLPPQIRTALVIKDGKPAECDFLIGTHSLLYKNLSAFDLFMTDEQHRFGTNQRLKLEKMLEVDGKKPHNIQFSATPIPRTMAMIEAQFIDFCFIKDLPYPKNIRTQIITRQGFGALFSHIKEQIALNKQVAIIYPLVEQSEGIAYQSIAEGLPFWQKHFERVFATHGKDADKEQILEAFRNTNGAILVATTLFEVGISLPNLTTIAIVGAERLGFATLHQLRGRVSRNGEQGFCYLYTNNADSARLKEFSETENGFEIAELDLKYRNSGDILRGIRQSGEQFRYFDFATDKELVEKAVKCV
ncbi:ATP-dependent DNA helicase RecG [Helicobacter sp. 23-1044]